MAAEGDSVACPACNSIGVIALTGPHHTEILNGRNAALEGDLCLCKCSPPPHLIANQSLRSQSFSDSEAAAFAASAPRQAVPTTRPVALGSQSLAPEGAEALEEEEEDLEGITLRLGMFFDGTGNNQANTALTEQCRSDDRQRFDESTLSAISAYCARYGFHDPDDKGAFRITPNDSYGNAPSNVAHLYDLYQDNAVSPMPAGAKTGYVPIYIEGIGTTSGESDSRISQGRGEAKPVCCNEWRKVRN